jgi:Holliday junction resolvase RusA-like endonuclease
MNFVVMNERGIGKPRMTNRDKFAERECVVKYWQYKERLQAFFRKNRLDLDDGVLHFRCEFSFPKSYSKKKRKLLLNKPHQVKPDIDNIAKGIMDSVLKNDSTVWKLSAEKFWGESDKIIFYIS